VTKRRLAVVVLVLAGALVGTTLPAGGADPTTPSGREEAPGDGCQRNPVGLLSYTSPEWVFIRYEQAGEGNPDNIKQMDGRVLEDPGHPYWTEHPAPGGGDLPEGHEWYDFNADIEPLNPSQTYLTAGDATVHTERESGQMPTAAWATADDQVSIWGSWIWDCGHWGSGAQFGADQDSFTGDRDYFLPGYQQLPGDEGTDLGGGESAELHPVRAVAVLRTNPYLSPIDQTEADFYVSNYGTLAHAEEVCAHDNPGPTGQPTMGPNYSGCLQDPVKRMWAINDRDYRFFVPAPPKPPGVTNPVMRIQAVENDGQVGTRQPPIEYERTDSGFWVTIKYDGFDYGGEPNQAPRQCPAPATHPEHGIYPPYDCPTQATSKAFFVGWEGDTQRIRDDLLLTVKSVTVHNSLDNPEFTTAAQEPPGEYGIDMDANGLWTYLNDYAAGLDHVNDDTTLQFADKDGKQPAFHLRVKDGGRVRIAFFPRECDLPRMNPCFVTNEAAEENDRPGYIRDVYPSADAAIGDHTSYGGPADRNTPQPKESANWEITYSIARIEHPATGSPAQAGAAGGATTGPVASTYPDSGPPASGGVQGQRSSCVDTYSPRSRFRGPSRRDSHHSPLRVSRRGVSFRGRAVDADCRGKRGPVARVEVAVARIVGKRCRFLAASGKFSAAASCGAPRSFMRAKGAASWRFTKRARLPRGRYRAYSRAVDPAGNIEYGAHTGNRARFKVR
jgi:hypothetical protein